MRRRRRNSDAIAPEVEPDEQASELTAAAAFDAAENLLSATLDEVQSAAPVSPADDVSPQTAASGGNGAKHAAQEESIPERPREDVPAPAAGGGESHALKPANGRRRRRTPDPAALPVPSQTGDVSWAPTAQGNGEPASIETLDSEPSRERDDPAFWDSSSRHRRWRRQREGTVPGASGAAASVTTAGFETPSVETPSVAPGPPHRRWRRHSTSDEMQLPFASSDVSNVGDAV